MRFLKEFPGTGTQRFTIGRNLIIFRYSHDYHFVPYRNLISVYRRSANPEIFNWIFNSQSIQELLEHKDVLAEEKRIIVWNINEF